MCVFNIPVDDPTAAGLMKFSSGKVRGFNLEVPIAIVLADALFLTVTPNLFHNFAGGGSTTTSSKFQLTYQPQENIALSVEANVPFTGENGFDYTIKPSIQIYF